ncbi:hypothetical protein CU254_23355 [Amycolatopsis sp. AA4]|uniref:hypothetical protein n=1 Tax=Actinomycetes TaxID=1760 RepID=UPI0001B5508F|nr:MULTISPECIES: hypothetical protein [Actinomycetes]ATY13051.1 hypothetical protein CU254_23355 [Amycolatopsis sp. AA4]EFL08928.1 hypothetical protein SSMG_04599 [Streptomyces sp. AA4]
MIEVLTSGVALGVHVPGLLLAQRLRERGAAADVSVLERLLPPHKLATTAEMKWAFHRDFRLAKAGHRLATDPAAVTDPSAEAELFTRWDTEQVETFVLFSGFWLPIVERYLARGRAVRVVLCHIDAIASPSFRKAAGWQVPHEDVFLVDGASMTVPCSVPVSARPPLPWAEREPRLYLHGGGWGMGTYREHVAALAGAGFALDVLAYRESDVDPRAGIRHFLLDPDWHPWYDNGFPPFRPAGRESYSRGEAHPDSFELVRSARAMVSKPGGGTCLDSLWAATPLLLLEPLGAAEKRNAEVWQRLGFGLPYETWRDSGFSGELLAEMHGNLVRALPGIADYSAELAA